MRHPNGLLLIALPVIVGFVASHCPGQAVHELWKSKCVGCHGEAGGDLRERSDWLGGGDRALFDAVLGHGEQDLPGFDDGTAGNDLSAREAWALVNYLREFQEQGRKEREAAPTPRARGVFESSHHSYRVETVVGDGLDTPWSVDWLSDGRMLVAERGGALSVVDEDGVKRPVRDLPSVRAQGQGGLMDVAVLPGDAEWVYLSYSHARGGDGMTRIVRGKLIDGERRSLGWAGEELIWEADADDYVGGGLHFGCRVVFDGDGHVYFTIGERGRGAHAQDLTRPNGKVHRVNLDGSVPSDNPFVGKGGGDGGVYESIWSYGHRNPQGLAFGDDGVLWDTEHGPRGGDEVNVIGRGLNYGWPLVSFGMNYSGKALEAPWADVVGIREEIEMPLFRWLPSIAACGLDVMRAEGMFPGWKGDLFAGGLVGQCLERLRFEGGVVTEREELLREIGRVRDVVIGPEGAVYVVLNGPDKIVRLVEAG